MGCTTKRRKSHLAGTHGEGFKVASLVMIRNGYQARFETSSYYWNFRFGGNNQAQLYCYLRPISKAKLDHQMVAYKKSVDRGTARTLKANIWEDVSVKIGRVYNSEGATIGIAEFQDWLKVSIDLDPPSKVISTEHGQLIMDPAFGGRIYLKGLLVETEPTKFKYGYNFSHGQINRDRQRLANSKEEAKVLAKIWVDSIEKQKAEITGDYIHLLQAGTRWSDVNLAKDYISKATAAAIWQHLLNNDPDKLCFYHDDKNGDRVQFIFCSILC